MTDRLYSFIGGETGAWRVAEMRAVKGAGMAKPASLQITGGSPQILPPGAKWILRGVTSNERYTTRAEKKLLTARQEGLNRPRATCAALIPIRKTPEWWQLAQDERREILEAKSKHIETGLKYLPAIARRLHHSRDLPGEEFDFLTWFEFAPDDAEKFDELVADLRRSEEWKYVEREVDVRLVRQQS